jgi:fatty acid desaturase
MPLMLGLVSFWLIWQFYAISCFFLQEEKTLKIAWKNGLAIILLQPGYAIIIAIVMLVLLGLSITTFIPLFLGSVPLIAILGLQAVQATLKQDSA